jgi:hypothetical protein
MQDIRISKAKPIPAVLLIGLLLLSTGWIFDCFCPELLKYWTGHYGNWRDLYLAQRIKSAAPFFYSWGILFIVSSPLLLLRNLNITPRTLHCLLLLLLAVTLETSCLLSLRDWNRFNQPCWEGYCDRAEVVADFFNNPSSKQFSRIINIFRENRLGTSFVPPLLVGVVAASGVPTTLAFMCISLAAWFITGLAITLIGRQILGFTKTQVFMAAILFFGNGAVMRFFVFPKSDPVAVACIILSIYLLLRLQQKFSLDRVAATSVVMVLGIFAKLSFLPVLAAPFVGFAYPLR